MSGNTLEIHRDVLRPARRPSSGNIEFGNEGTAIVEHGASTCQQGLHGRHIHDPPGHRVLKLCERLVDAAM